jgi:hypothetical protein
MSKRASTRDRDSLLLYCLLDVLLCCVKLLLQQLDLALQSLSCRSRSLVVIMRSLGLGDFDFSLFQFTFKNGQLGRVG